jgi:NAD(P)H dehydrogenase (quinone)
MAAATASSSSTAPKKAKIFVVYYSTYGHVRTLAQAVAKGVEAGGAEVKLFQIAETLPAEVLAKMGAPPKSADPVIEAAQLAEADGIIFGIPTRFGMPCAQFKALFDSTGGLWYTGALHGKVASTFFSTGTGGGRETTALTALTQFVHHGMIYVPIGYKNQKLATVTEVHGSSPWGAGTIAGADGRRAPTELELDLAQFQGNHVAGIVNALVKGRQ